MVIRALRVIEVIRAIRALGVIGVIGSFYRNCIIPENWLLRREIQGAQESHRAVYYRK